MRQETPPFGGRIALTFLILFLVVILALPVWYVISLVRRRRQRRRIQTRITETISAHAHTDLLPPTIAVAPLPGARVDEHSVMLGLITFSLIVIVGGLLLGLLHGEFHSNAFLTLVTVLGVIAVAMVVAWIFFIRGWRRARRYRSPEGSQHHLSGLLEALQVARLPAGSGTGASHRRAWPRLKRALEVADLGSRQVPSCVIDQIFLPDIKDIQLDSDLIEETPVLSSTLRGIQTKWVLVGLSILMAIVFAASGVWVLVGIIVVGNVWNLAQNPTIRRRLPWLRFELFSPLAGPGYVRDTKQRVWTCDDGLMLVRSATSRKPEVLPLAVTLVGPAGVIRFVFASVHDPDFRRLFSSWNCLNPRLEFAQGTV